MKYTLTITLDHVPFDNYKIWLHNLLHDESHNLTTDWNRRQNATMPIVDDLKTVVGSATLID